MKRFYNSLAATVLIGLSAQVAGYNHSYAKENEARILVVEDDIIISRSDGENHEDRNNFLNNSISLEKLTEQYINANPSSLKKSLEKKIIIDKSERILRVYLNNELLKEYGVSLGYEPVNDKQQQGDYSTPEGEFYVSKKVPGSRFHKALLINYPTIEDAERGLSSSLITQSQHDSIVQSNEKCQAPLHNTDLGGLIEIHGSGGGPGYSDWTHGCIAVTNNDMDELYNFSGTGCNMKVTIQQ